MLHLLSAYEGSYRIRVYFGERAWDYVLGFGTQGFIEAEASEDVVHEAYWANDLDDFLEGRCDEFSTFCRSQFPVEMRLWACLATPLLNGDLVTKRVRLHFERARKGLTPGSYVLPLYETR